MNLYRFSVRVSSLGASWSLLSYFSCNRQHIDPLKHSELYDPIDLSYIRSFDATRLQDLVPNDIVP